MTNPQNVELEAAKFLHKLIQESRDEPPKLATKLYVILQHMRSSGKENSMPYQVISRAMETVIKENNLDIESLMSPRLPLATGSQIGDSDSSQLAGSSQQVGSDKDSKPNFSGNEMETPDTYVSTRVHTGPTRGGSDVYQGSAAIESGSYKSAESANKMQFGNSSFDVAVKTSKDRSMEVLPSIPSGDHSSGKSIAGKTLDHGSSSMVTHANKGCSPSSLSDTNVLRTNASMDIGKFPICQASSPGRPFNDQQLKQLRAQCLVFLAFRNGMMPKPLHLEIALGNIFTKEDGSHRDLVDRKRKEQLVNDPSSAPQIPRSLEKGDSSTGHPSILNSYSSKEVDFAKLSEVKSSRPAIPAKIELDRKSLVARGKTNAEVLTHEARELHISAKLEPHDSSTREIISHNHENDLGISHQLINIAAAVMDLSEQSKLEESSGSGNGFPNDIHKVPFQTKFVMNDVVLQKMDDGKNHTQNPVDSNSLGKLYSDKKLPSIPLNDPWKPVVGITTQNYPAIPIKDSNRRLENVSQVSGAELEGDYIAISTERQPSPKHTTIERWIWERQKRKALTEQNWAHKQQKTEQKISSSADKLKQVVSASEDISAKTKSVIELKKLQLLELQRHLRSDILSDFFKPIASEMDRLKSLKKHRIGRRSKQIERFEQRMKEERQKRIRESQKEFFSDLEVHRERLEDGFKIKRERWKGLNRYAREFHKKKERLHREKIDRIQREKINLLKINDVEGYLRMVQDAKSDRVKQLLKETEKYLQKLGSKLKDAKAISRHFETDMEESKVVAEENEDSVENEDEAKHYLESNEKYYTMAHSVKENILEPPTGLIGGKLREYQMNGLRWLVSLYNNHLNGILADEMGLGKTVQVISLICYLMENKNDRGPFLVVVPSSVLPGWESEIKFWAPNIHRIVYSGPPEERRRLFKEHIVHQKFNVLLTTYEYLMNKHDRPKLSKIQWHYVIIDEGHRIKNASCKLNADLKHYRSNHRLLLTGTPLQNNLEELWALLNFLLPNIFNSSDDFSQWFNKPFESNGDNSLDEALLSEEENLLIINRLHQVLRPFVLRRLKHKVENQLPEKIERLIRCEASSYQKLLMKRVEDNLGAIGTSKARSVHNSVMELRNICNHPYLSQLHVEEVHDLIPKHYLPHVVRLCGKLEMLDRLLPKLKATDHRVLFFSTMTRLLDVMEDYLCWKQYKYLRLDGHTSGGDRGGLIERFNQPDSPYFIFLLSIRAGGVGVNLQAADTVIIFDTDWNPQVDLQAQARAHRIGQKKDVLVLRLETVQTVEEQVRASAEHKLGVANQSITAGFFDNNTSAEDRREYLETLLRENKKEEVAPVLDDDSLNDVIARREEEIDIFESVDKQRRDEEMAAWKNMFDEKGSDKTIEIPPLPSRLLTEDDLKSFYEVMKITDTPTPVVLPNAGVKRKSGYLGGLDTQQYGRGKRAREVRSYEEQMTEEEFERLCGVESPESPIVKKEVSGKTTMVVAGNLTVVEGGTQAPALPTQLPQHSTVEPTTLQNKEVTAVDVATSTPPSKRGRGRPKRAAVEYSSPVPSSLPPGFDEPEVVPKVETTIVGPSLDSFPSTTYVRSITASVQESDIPITTDSDPAIIPPSVTPTSQTGRGRGRGRKSQTGGEPPASRRRSKVQAITLQPVPLTVSQSVTDKPLIGEFASSSLVAKSAGAISGSNFLKEVPNELNSALPASVVPSASPMKPLVLPVSVAPLASDQRAVDVSPQLGVETDPAIASDQAFIAPMAMESVNKPDPGIATVLGPQASAPLPSGVLASQSVIPSSPVIVQGRRKGQGRERGRGRGLNAQSQEETPPPQRRRRRQEPVVSMIPGAAGHDSASSEPPQKITRVSVGKDTVIGEKGQGLKKASQYAALDVKSPSALHVSKGKGTAEEKFADAPQDQTKNAKGVKDHANVVLALSFNSSDVVQSVLTSVPAAKASSVIPESGNKFSTGSGEPNNKKVPDNKDSCGSFISVPVMFGIDDKQGPSKDPQSLLIINRDSIEMEKDQGVNRSAVVVATSEAVPLVSENDEVKINVSKKSTNTDEHLASDSLLKRVTDNVSSNSIPELCDSKDTLVAPEESQSLPVLSRISVETDKEQVLNSAKAHDASALGSMPLPGESDNSESHFVKEEEKITESFESPNLDESLVSIGNTSEKMKNTNNESGEVQMNEHENNTTTAEADVSKSELHVDSSAVVTCTGSFTEPISVSPDALVLFASGNVEVESQGAMTGSSMTRMVPVAGHDRVIASTLKAEVQDMADPSVEQVPKDSLLKGVTNCVVTHQGVVNDTLVVASSDAITDPVAVASVDPASSPQVSAQGTEDPSAEQVRKDTDIRSTELDNSPQGQQDASEKQVSKATCPSPEDSEPLEDPSDGALNTASEVLEDEHTKESAVAPEVFILATEAACHTLVDSAAAPEDLSVNPIFVDTSKNVPTEERPEENAAPLEEVSILTTKQVLHLNSSFDVVVNTTSFDIANEHLEDKPAAVEVSILPTEQILHATSLSDVAVNMARSDIVNEQPEEKPAAFEVSIHPNSSSDMAVKMVRSDIANEQPEEKPVAIEVSIHPNSSSDVAVNTASSDVASEHPEEKPVAVEVCISATEQVLYPNSLSDVAVNMARSDIANEQPEEKPSAIEVSIHPNCSSDMAVNMARSDIANEQPEEKPAAVEISIHPHSSSDMAVKMARSDIANEQQEEKPAAVEVSILPNSSSDMAVKMAISAIANEQPEEKPVAVSIHPNSSSDVAVNTASSDVASEHPEEKPVAVEVCISATEQVLYPNRLSDVAVNMARSDIDNEQPEEKPSAIEVSIHPNSSSDMAVNMARSDIANEQPEEKPAAVEISIHPNSSSDMAVKMARSNIANEQPEEKPAAVEVSIHPNSSSDMAVKMAISDIANEQPEEKPVTVSIHPNSSSDVAVNTASSDIVSEHPEEKPVAVEVCISATEQVLHPNSLSDVAVNTMSSDVVNEQPEEKPASVEVSISSTGHVHLNSLSDVAVHTASSDIIKEHPEEIPTGVEVSISTIEQVSHSISSSDMVVNTGRSDIANEYLEKPAAFDVCNSTTGLLKVKDLDSTPEESTPSVAMEEESPEESTPSVALEEESLV